MENKIYQVSNPGEVINVDYNPEKAGNGGLTIEERLIKLEEEINSLNLKELD